MKKYSFLRKYYPFILLLAGIAILYYFINTTEGFQSSTPVSIYLYRGDDNAVKFADSTDKDIVNLNKLVKSSAKVNAGMITLQLPNYIVNTYNVSAYGINCSNKSVKDPKTGRDVGDLMPGSIELMPINVIARNDHITHEGDMGRLGKSE